MRQVERLDYLIKHLVSEYDDSSNINMPDDIEEKKKLLRSLMNVRMPSEINESFLKIQDDYLQEELKQKGIVKLSDLTPIDNYLFVWHGDITRLNVDAIVNAANHRLLGCFIPLHHCIDNAIHSCAGIQLRQECYEIMQRQQHDEITGIAKLTNAYNLPCRYVIHTVGPVIRDKLTLKDCELLQSCYQECLQLAYEKKLKSIAFCCISTGEFRFPNEEAAKIAVQVVNEFQRQHKECSLKVVFNVFKDLDMRIYEQLLREN